MSQFDPVIGGDKSGIAYRQDDNNGKKALLTHHKGATPPAYAEAGIIWLDDSATPWQLKLYDGSDWIVTAAVNASTNQFSPFFNGAALQSGTETVAGLLRKATEAEAIAGTDDEAAMTALRTAQAIGAMDISGGGLIGYQVFEASGTYDKAVNNPSFVIVEVQGGGGGGGGTNQPGYSGGGSAFGSHCSASGGQGGGNGHPNPGGVGGSGTGGDLNITGATGEPAPIAQSGGDPRLGGTGGASYFHAGGAHRYNHSNTNAFGRPGVMGSGGGSNTTSSGGGAGGYARKQITADMLETTETVTVGSGGAQVSSGYRSAGGDGLVIVWEYA